MLVVPVSFDFDLWNLKLISLDNGLKHSISININNIELLDVYNPKIEKEDFEVIDLRG